MQYLDNLTCECIHCAGESCLCGCQSAAQAACDCGADCRCGPDCACGCGAAA